MDKQKINTDNFPATQSDGDAATQSNDDEVKDKYSSQAQNQTSFKDFMRIFSYSTTGDKVVLIIACLAQIGTGVTLPLMNIVFGKLVGNFSDYFLPGTTTTKAEFTSTINNLTLFVTYLFIARWVLSYISMFTFRLVGLRISAKLRLNYLKALFSLPVGVLDTLPSGQASNTITTTANILQVGISEKLGTILQYLALLITAIVIAFTYSWALTLVTSSVLLFVALVYGTIIPIVMKMSKNIEHADEKASGVAGEVLGSIRMIVACGSEDRTAKKYAGWVEESRKRTLKMSPWVGVQFSPLMFAIYATMALCFWFGFRLFSEGHLENVGTILIVLMSVVMVAMAVSQTAAPIMAAGKAATAATDFFAVIDTPRPDTSGLKEPEVSAREDITLNSVTFAYPSRPHVKVLDDLSMRFESGKITAIVGASGSGKSTIVGLLERWYNLEEQRIVIPPSAMKDEKKDKKKEEERPNTPEEYDEKQDPVALSGIIACGNNELRSLDLRWWRTQIGLVQQEPFIFNDTIAKNVEYGLIGSEWELENAEMKRKLVIEACKEAFADEYITKLPLGYDTQVGDAGIKLSGGQRQRLAIARSIIKRPKILILDEATSAIDVRGEQIVQAALDKVSEGRTTITIAHRLSTIKKADKIVVLKKGKLVEEGTHEGLLSNPDGAYSALVNAQQLSLGDVYQEGSNLVETVDPLIREMSAAEKEKEQEEAVAYKPKGLVRSLGLFLYEQRARSQWYLMLVIGAIAAGAAYPIQAYLFAQIISVFSLTGPRLKAATEHYALMFFILGLGAGVAWFIMGYSSTIISGHITSTYRQEYFESILHKPIAFFDAEENSSGELTGRVANDPTQLQQLLGINMAMVLTAICNITGCIIIAFVFGWKLTCVVAFVALPLLICGSFYRIRYEIQFERMNQAVFAESSKFAAEAISAFRTVTSLTLEDMICTRYEELLKWHVKGHAKKSRYSSIVFAASDSLGLGCMALAFWYGGTLLASREYGPINFFVVYIAIINGAESAGSLLSFGPNMAQASAAANRILSFRLPAKVTGNSASQIQNIEGGVKIELKDVWFKYPTRDVPIFTGLSITIKKGQFAALVGPSGCGKTSIVSLLERFYDVQKGKILCNDADISELDIREYRKMISLVAQEPTLFEGTIKENIYLGVDESTPEETLHKVCRDAEIHDFIMSLPDGYNTNVGTKGVALSGGQKQRISIARALIRNPKILLLDEATSSLDSESERLVQAAFERAATGRTMVVVAHRLATVQNADVIFVLGEGRVLEVGDHAALLRKKGVYYQMCQSQALDR
ncbi:putative abc transporter protein [Botrytis fragariae]|uniref:Putative abc transporter protein n=1 Tax=Botrytis fragariae TaxID=1964551 RepID=A0A8H6B315_9HELO|nr:putative abc transporter protein [Botrytis fragariae]KAF5878245.1 putative abc transporter protein [Botrytis fragariae]